MSLIDVVSAPSREADPVPSSVDVAIAGWGQLLSRSELAAMLPEFMDVYERRPIRDNFGGMRFNHSFCTYAVLRKLEPATVIESGVFKGQSTWLIEQAVPGAQIVCIDPSPGGRLYTSRRARYFTDDFGLIDWSDVDVARAVCFFDDHQNAYARLMDLRWWGFRHAIFEDNFPCGEGDCYSLRHALAGFGHPHMQMSRHFTGTWKEQLRRRVQERILWGLYPRQQSLRRPNAVDAVALRRNLRIYQELPPVLKYETNGWGGPWSGAYQACEPLYARGDEGPLAARLGRIEQAEPGTAFEYGYICYVELGAS